MILEYMMIESMILHDMIHPYSGTALRGGKSFEDRRRQKGSRRISQRYIYARKYRYEY